MQFKIPIKISDGNSENWECAMFSSVKVSQDEMQNKAYWGTGELLVIEDQVQLSVWGQLLHLQPQPHFPFLQNIDVPARYQLDHWQAERSPRGITGTPQDLDQPGLCWVPFPQAGPLLVAFCCFNLRGFLISWLRFSNLSRSEMQRRKSQH